MQDAMTSSAQASATWPALTGAEQQQIVLSMNTRTLREMSHAS